MSLSWCLRCLVCEEETLSVVLMWFRDRRAKDNASRFQFGERRIGGRHGDLLVIGVESGDAAERCLWRSSSSPWVFVTTILRGVPTCWQSGFGSDGTGRCCFWRSVICHGLIETSVIRRLPTCWQSDFGNAGMVWCFFRWSASCHRWLRQQTLSRCQHVGMASRLLFSERSATRGGND